MSWRFTSGVFVSLIFFFLTQDFYKWLETQTWSHFNPRKADRLGAFWGVLKINNNSGLNGNVAVRCAAWAGFVFPSRTAEHSAPNSGYPISHKCTEAWLRPQILGPLFFCWNQSCSTQGLFLGSVWHLLVPAHPYSTVFYRNAFSWVWLGGGLRTLEDRVSDKGCKYMTEWLQYQPVLKICQFTMDGSKFCPEVVFPLTVFKQWTVSALM